MISNPLRFNLLIVEDAPTVDETQDIWLEKIRALISRGENEELISLLSSRRPPEIADLINSIEGEEKSSLFRLLDHDTASEVITQLDDTSREQVVAGLNDGQLSQIVAKLDSDEATDLVSELSQDRAQNVLDLLGDVESREVQELLRYHHETAGGIMAAEYVSVNQGATADQAIERIRAQKDRVEEVYNVYVTDDDGELVGVLSLKKLLLAPGQTPVSRVMNPEVIKASTGLDREEVASLFKRYDLVAMPVVDEAGHLVGRITIDDVIDVIEDEVSEDISRMAGTDEEELHERSVLKIAGMRLPWIIASLFGGLFSASVMGHFEQTLLSLITLSFFVPVIMAMGGNIGIQSSYIVVRGLATGEVYLTRTARRLLREMRIGMVMGLICGTTVGLVAYLWQGDWKLGIIVSTAMLSAITVAATMGTLVPLIFKRLGIDPAIATGPFVTTSNDIVGLSIYFGLATMMLRWFR